MAKLNQAETRSWALHLVLTPGWQGSEYLAIVHWSHWEQDQHQLYLLCHSTGPPAGPLPVLFLKVYCIRRWVYWFSKGLILLKKCQSKEQKMKVLNQLVIQTSNVYFLCRGKKYGETANECGEAFFFYGKSLLELARYVFSSLICKQNECFLFMVNFKS